MPKVPQGCLAGIAEAMPQFTDDELKQYAVDVFNRARKYEDLTGTAAIKRAQDELHNERLASFYNEAQIKINNTSKFERMKNKIVQKGLDMRDLLARRYRNLADNVESAQHAARDRLSREFYDELSAEDLAYFGKKENQMDVARVIDGARGSPEAEKIAAQYKRYIERRNAETVNSNAMPLDYIQKDRFLRAAHDASKLLNGGRSLAQAAKSPGKYSTANSKTEWINFIKPHLNLEKTFEETHALDLAGQLDEKAITKILSNVYDNITTGKSEIFTKSVVANDREAVANKSRMFFVWKNMQSFAKYNEKYGHGDLFTAVQGDINASANKIGMAELFGDSPSKAYLDLKTAQQEVKGKGGLWWRNTDNLYKEVTGENKGAVSPRLANFLGNIRMYSSMARLPGLVLQSITDTATAANYASRWHVNYGKAMVNQLDSVFRYAADSEKKYIAKLFRANLQGHIGYMGKFIDAQNMGAITSKVSTQYFRAIGMQAWDQGNRIGIMQTMSRHLANESKKPLSALHPELQKQLSKFDITDKEWDLLRSKNQKGLFTTENVDALTNDELRSLYNSSDGSVPLHELRNSLQRKVYSIFDVASENAVLTPGAFVRSFMTQGTNPGSILGEAMRTVMQFKGFPLTYIDRALIGSFKDADGAMGKLAWAMQQFGFVFPLSYMSTYFYYLGQGLSMPDPAKMSVPQKIAHFGQMMMPGLGALSMVLDPQQQNPNLLSSIFTTPSMRLMSNAASVPLALASGNPEKAGKSALKGLQYLAPTGAIPFASPYIKAAMGEEPYLQPGQQQLYGK